MPTFQFEIIVQTCNGEPDLGRPKVINLPKVIQSINTGTTSRTFTRDSTFIQAGRNLDLQSIKDAA